MDVSVVRVSELESSRRIDAEYYKPMYLLQDQKLENLAPQALSSIVKVFDGNHMTIKDEFSDNGIRYLRGQDLSSFFISDSNPVYISKELYDKMPRCHMKPGDVLLSVIGTVGSVSFVTDKYDFLTGSCKIAILRANKVNPYFLAAYLMSDTGQGQIQRRARGAVQQGLILPDLKEIPVPTISDEHAKKVERLFKQSLQKTSDSINFYADAENLLASELGLDKLDLSESLFSVKKVSDIQKLNRIDAEYFQPKYERTLRLMGKSGKTIKDIADLGKRRFEPVAGKPFQYIEISDLSSDGLAESQTIQGEEAPSRAQWIVGKGDVITSTVRPIRRLSAIIAAEQDGFVCSSGFAVLKPKSIPSELLLTYLRIPVVCEILDLFTTASMYPAISTADLLNIPVTLPTDKKIVNEIVSKIQQSRQARQEAKRLLAEAKSAVEGLIEGG